MPAQREQRPVGAAICIGKEDDWTAGVAPCSLAEDHRLGTEPVADLAQTVFAGIHRFIPADARPLVLAALTQSLHRIAQTIGMVNVLPQSQGADKVFPGERDGLRPLQPSEIYRP